MGVEMWKEETRPSANLASGARPASRTDTPEIQTTPSSNGGQKVSGNTPQFLKFFKIVCGGFGRGLPFWERIYVYEQIRYLWSLMVKGEEKQ